MRLRVVCPTIEWHNIVSVCIFVLIYKWGGRSRREGFLNLLHSPRESIGSTVMFLNVPEVM
jgi:hypothetical protein